MEPITPSCKKVTDYGNLKAPFPLKGKGPNDDDERLLPMFVEIIFCRRVSLQGHSLLTTNVTAKVLLDRPLATNSNYRSDKKLSTSKPLHSRGECRERQNRVSAELVLVIYAFLMILAKRTC